MSDPVIGSPTPSATEPDWRREYKRAFDWNPSRSLLASIRAYQAASGPLGAVRKKIAVLRHRFWSVVTSADIPINSRIGGGLLIPHPNGIVIAPDAVIGLNCLLFQQVTIGHADGGVPTLGGHVDVGAGAKILGPVHVGDHARVGANAVVVDNVPDGATVVGIPARILGAT
jgi:serine O-acetyltransferase